MQDYLPQLLDTLNTLEPLAALQQLQQAAEEHPADARPFLLMAAQCAEMGRMDPAEAAFISALQRAPDFAIARFQLGLLQFSSARPTCAIATWAPLDALDAHHPLRQFKTGLEFLAVDKFDEAVEWLRQGIASNTDNPALNDDMQRFLDEIAKLQGQPGAAASAGANQEPTEHFLVSAYRQH